MNHGLLLLFLTTSCWFYMALLLVLTDWRWNAGRIAQTIACVGAGGWLLLTGKTGATPACAIVALFCATIIIPLFLRRVIHRRLLAGHIEKARFYQAIFAFLTCGRTRVIFAAVRKINALIQSELSHPAAQRNARHLLIPIQSALTQSVFQGAQIDALVTLQHYADAVSLYDERFSNRNLKPDISVWFALAIAHAELGNLDQAVGCIRHTAETEETPSALDPRPFLAYIRVFACGGRPDDVEYLLTRAARLTALLPPAYPHLYQGLALMRAGQRDSAETAFAQARASLRPTDELIHRLIERHSAELSAAQSAETHPAMSSDLNALRRRAELAPVSLAASSRRRRLLLTQGFIAATIVVWFLTERAGSSTDARTLLRFGANMPALALHGQWWRLASSIFLHVGFMHLLFNAYACYLFGSFVERMTGRWSTFTILILSGVSGSAASAFFGEWFGRNAISAGASGAVFGLLGAAIVVVLRLPGYFTKRQRRFYAFNLIFIAAINMLFGLFEKNVDNLAHAGGFATGLLCGIALMAGINHPGRRSGWRLAAFFSVIILAASAVGALYNFSTGGYPRRPPPMKTVSGPKGEWRITVPVFWNKEISTEQTVIFTDPLGPKFSIQAGPRPLLRAPSRRILYRHSLIIRGRSFNEIAIAGEHKLTFAYHLRAQDKNYLLQFACATEDARQYSRLLRRMLVSFEPEPYKDH